MGSKHPTIAPYQAFPTADGYVVVAVSSENFWPRFCRAMDLEELIDDERFAVNSLRVENRDVLDELLDEEMREYTTEEVVARMDEEGVPASPVRDLSEVFDRDQVRARGMRVSVDHPTIGDLELPGVPMHFSETPAEVRTHPPLHGEHTAEVLEAFGYTQETIDRFEEEGVI